MLSFLFFFSFPGLAFSSSIPLYDTQSVYSFAFYAPQLSLAVKSLLQVPDCLQLLQEVQKLGPVGLKWEHLGSNSSDAAWYGDQRVIAVNASKRHTEGQKICSILFEMHNAINNYKFLQLDRLAREHKIDKESYVESIERLEHQNALNTKRLLEKGISLGIFPKDARWPIIHCFEDHYKVQQIMGHSHQISCVFDDLNARGRSVSYVGTVQNAKNLTQPEKKKLLSYLSLKDNLEYGSSSEKEHARRILHQTYHELKFKPHSFRGNENFQMVVLNDIFRGNTEFEKLRRTVGL